MAQGSLGIELMVGLFILSFCMIIVAQALWIANKSFFMAKRHAELLERQVVLLDSLERESAKNEGVWDGHEVCCRWFTKEIKPVIGGDSLFEQGGKAPFLVIQGQIKGLNGVYKSTLITILTH